MKTASAPAGPAGVPVSGVVSAVNEAEPQAGMRERARAFAEPLLAGETTATGENLLTHADAVADILAGIGGAESIQAAAYLGYACAQLSRPEEVIGKAFGENFARLAIETARLEQLQQRSRAGRADQPTDSEQAGQQTEAVRKMLLAFSRDLRVVLLRLASRLQTLRWCAAQRQPLAPSVLREAHEVFAPLANRLGIWQIKWELEDLIFRAQEPDTYRQIAGLLDEKRTEREAALEQRRAEIETALRAQGIDAAVSGRPKHISSIVRKMRGKGLDFEHVFDVRALRIMVPGVADCYAALDWVHQHFSAVAGEFDDYIVRPKVNGYQSLHTVVRDTEGRAWEIQIRTRAMHEHAEHGVAAHWAYKEAGAKGYAGVSAASQYDAKIAVLRQLLAWERDLSGSAAQHGLLDDRIYVLTPEAAVVELPAGATPVDFAYTVHTDIGHACVGSRVDRHPYPLSSPLHSGQTVEIITAPGARPNAAWLNFVVTTKARSKIRQFLKNLRTEESVVLGRRLLNHALGAKNIEDIPEPRIKQVLADTKHENLQGLLADVGLGNAMSVMVARRMLGDELPPEEQPKSSSKKMPIKGADGMLVTFANCCRPIPGDAIIAHISPGKGLVIHQEACRNIKGYSKEPDKYLPVQWEVDKEQEQEFRTGISIEIVNHQGALAELANVIAATGANIHAISTEEKDGRVYLVTLLITTKSRIHLANIMRKIRVMPNVLRVSRQKN